MEEAKQNSDSPQARLDRGEVLMIDDQWRSYISKDGEGVKMRGILAKLEDHAKSVDMEPQYSEKHFASLTEALLSLTDYVWRDADGNFTASQTIFQIKEL